MKCAVCGKPIEEYPRLFHRLTGERVCRDCLNACYHSEAFRRTGKDPETAGGILSYMGKSGKVKIRCGLLTAVFRLCELEDQRNPKERYTLRENGKHRPGVCLARYGIENVLARLYEYEHPKKARKRRSKKCRSTNSAPASNGKTP